MKRLSLLVLCFSILMGAGAAALAGEHPGHGAEHPGAVSPPTAAQIQSAILAHIEAETAAHDGKFPIADEKTGETLSLRFDKLHDDKVANILKGSGKGASFACTDFLAEDGTRYDLDFWMKPDSAGQLQVVDTKIHKVNGDPRYTYQDDEIVQVA